MGYFVSRFPLLGNVPLAIGETIVRVPFPTPVGRRSLASEILQMLHELAEGTGALAQPGVTGLSSYHPGGANVLMCDGSVRFLKDSIPCTALETRLAAQGEVISADEY